MPRAGEAGLRGRATVVWLRTAAARVRAVALSLLLAIPGVAASQPAERTSVRRAAASFDRHFVTVPAQVAQARRSGDLAGAVGWFDYDIDIDAPGWFELIVDGYMLGVQTTIRERNSGREVFREEVSLGFDGKTDKVSNVWLPQGAYTLRLLREYWTGFPAVRSFSLIPATSLAGRVRAEKPIRRVFRLGDCEPIRILASAGTSATALNWTMTDGEGRTRRTGELRIPAGSDPQAFRFTPPCDTPGSAVVYFATPAQRVTNRDIHQFHYQVVDLKGALAPSLAPPRRSLVAEIDFTSREPDYRVGPAQVVQTAAGSYRQSGPNGWLERQHGDPLRANPHWFAYVLQGLQPQTLHQVEIDFPDDARRTFVIALREPATTGYPVAGGVDSGGEFPLSNAMRTQSLLFWPASRDPRLVLMPAHDGQPAAAARARVYRIDEPLAPLARPQKNRRQFVNWYEEGSHFLGTFGAPGTDPAQSLIASERWAQAAAHMGITILSPTVSIYSFTLYPSRFHRHFAQPWGTDTLQQILLSAERHGIGVIPDLHPRADNLNWAFIDEPVPKTHLLASARGQTVDDLPPFFNPLHPANQDWYVEMIGELVDNYRDSPALRGVSLRFMGWKNPTLHNFHSLDWGYDDLTVGLFEKETGISVPAARTDPGRFMARHRWLTTAAREKWIAWRAQKVAALLVRIRDRVRKARPDLEVFVPLFPISGGGAAYFSGRDWLLEAGFDHRLLRGIDGLHLIDATHLYGRRWGQPIDALLRDYLIRPDRGPLGAGAATQRPNRFLSTAVYLEATEVVATPAQLGFDARARAGWTSGVANPPGRLYLERFAIQLGRHDAVMLGDGGNAYTLGQPELREFLAEYLQLPAEPFTLHTAPDARAAVWSRRQNDGTYFYAVNTSAAPRRVEVQFSAAAVVERIALGETGKTTGAFAIDLLPFQLKVFRTTSGVAVTSVRQDSGRCPAGRRFSAPKSDSTKRAAIIALPRSLG